MQESCDSRSAHQVANGVADAMRTMNVAALGQFYADDIVVWHNFDTKTQSKQENLTFLEDFFTRCSGVLYENIDRHITDFGYLQQHLLKIALKSGRAVSIPCCHIVKIKAGLIWRFDKYFDPAPFYHLFAA